MLYVYCIRIYTARIKQIETEKPTSLRFYDRCRMVKYYNILGAFAPVPPKFNCSQQASWSRLQLAVGQLQREYCVLAHGRWSGEAQKELRSREPRLKKGDKGDWLMILSMISSPCAGHIPELLDFVPFFGTVVCCPQFLSGLQST